MVGFLRDEFVVTTSKEKHMLRQLNMFAVFAMSLLLGGAADAGSATTICYYPRHQNIIAAASSFQSLISTSCWLGGTLLIVMGLMNLRRAAKMTA
jgi:hypothetical protein